MVGGAIAQAIGPLDWERLVDHRIRDFWLLGNHVWLVNVDIVRALAAIDSGSVVGHDV